MNRLQVIQALMKNRKTRNYLEIGVFNGHIFFRIKSDFKIAVDPDFRFDTSRKIGKTILNPYNLYNRYYSKTSDEFFAADAPQLLKGKTLDISLIDGMHEFDFALRDVENTLKYLAKDGVIVMHDCNPLTEAAASSFADWEKRKFRDTWNGDVWKVILYLQCKRKDLNVFTLDCDHGLGIVTFGKPEQQLEYSEQQIRGFSFQEFTQNRERWLNLKPASYFQEYFEVSAS